mgnify:CR=1 FL=1
MDEFERLLEAERVSVERFVRFRMSSKADADDVLQEIFLTASHSKRGSLALQETNAMIISERKRLSTKFRSMS